MKPTYEEQIRAIGNGKLLQSGCYDENLNLLSEDYMDASGLKDNVAYVIIPEGVTDIKENQFYECSALKNVVIPETVTEIKSFAFADCFELASVIIPDSVTSIGDHAFFRCSELKNAMLSENLNKIEVATFCECLNLKNINISDDVISIKAGAFSDCVRLFLKIPDSVKEIEQDAFLAVPNILINTNIDLDESGVKTINGFVEGNLVFLDEDKTELRACLEMDTEIIIPDGVKYINDNAFSNNYQVEKVTIPNSVVAIGESAFENCPNLKEVAMSDNINFIDEKAFYDCYQLSDLKIPNNEDMYIGQSAFFNVNNVIYNGDFTIDTNGDNWGAYVVNGYQDGDFIYEDETKTALLRYKGLDSNVTIPNTVQTIGNAAFFDCPITSVTIPDSVTSIGDFAFSLCHNLSEVNIPNSVSHIGTIAFDSTTQVLREDVLDSGDGLETPEQEYNEGEYNEGDIEP